MDPNTLPIREYSERIVNAVRNHPVTIVIGETGSGKTTQISQVEVTACNAANLCVARSVGCVHVMHPDSLLCKAQILEEAGFAKDGRIAVTQPRRVV